MSHGLPSPGNPTIRGPLGNSIGRSGKSRRILDVVRAWPTVAVAILLVASTSAQTRPDFSGRWGADADPAAARGRSGDMGSGWGSPITITQAGGRLTVEYMFFGRGDMQPPTRLVYALDGSETKNSVMMGRGIQAQTSKTAWNGDKLVITTVHTFSNPETGKPMTMDVTQTLSLESPTSLVVETTRSGVLGGPPSTVRSVFKKI